MPPIKRVRLAERPWRGVLSFEPVIEELRGLLPPTFEDLDKNFAVGVVGIGSRDYIGKQHELIRTGPLPEAIVASAAVPVMFSPVNIPDSRNGPYIDGGVACRIGLNLWREHREQDREDEPHPALVHLIGRSSPLSGNDSLETIGKY